MAQTEGGTLLLDAVQPRLETTIAVGGQEVWLWKVWRCTGGFKLGAVALCSVWTDRSQLCPTLDARSADDGCGAALHSVSGSARCLPGPGCPLCTRSAAQSRNLAWIGACHWACQTSASAYQSRPGRGRLGLGACDCLQLRDTNTCYLSFHLHPHQPHSPSVASSISPTTVTSFPVL